MYNNGFRIVPVDRHVEYPLREFFTEIKDNKFFQPHPFTTQEASRLAWNKGNDLYYVIVHDNKVCGYGFLRGWDDNWDNICLGLIVTMNGLGRLLMYFLHAAARAKGVERLRLKVDPNNIDALALYIKMGYRFDEKRDNGEWVGYKTL